MSVCVSVSESVIDDVSVSVSVIECEFVWVSECVRVSEDLCEDVRANVCE